MGNTALCLPWWSASGLVKPMERRTMGRTASLKKRGGAQFPPPMRQGATSYDYSWAERTPWVRTPVGDQYQYRALTHLHAHSTRLDSTRLDYRPSTPYILLGYLHSVSPREPYQVPSDVTIERAAWIAQAAFRRLMYRIERGLWYMIYDRWWLGTEGWLAGQAAVDLPNVAATYFGRSLLTTSNP
ncbi:hypothetical protein F4859DRAFT_112429 [Xylaria cf. heliscus]|nr:hypothetical protein F4859DRAFT_112429 [Xylaria cf. heliscus]